MQLEDWAMDDHQIMLAYDHSRAPIDTGKTPMSDRLKRLRHFYLYLESIGLRSVKYITPEIIASYLKTEAGYSKVTIKHLHKSLREYFRFLYKYEHLSIDYSGYVPRVQATENANIPMIWTNDNVEKLLASIDLASPVGRRNYAIFLLIAELGIRACDINALKGSDIDWDKKTIHFDQEKTGDLNVLPLSDRAGWAIIDYVRYARPKVDSPYVFLTCNAPYTQLGKTTAVNALKQQMQIAGIKPSTPGAKTGIHSLRHSLARKLLDKNVSLEDIADIMGHTEVVSSSPYLKIDVEGLRGCALSLKEVAEYV
jgi:site-specific recombinase XerD